MTTIYVNDRDGVRHEVEATDGYKLMETLRDGDFGIEAICGGMCSCATCHIYVNTPGHAGLTEPEEEEQELLEDLEFFEENSRLSCQIDVTPLLAGLEVTISPEE